MTVLTRLPAKLTIVLVAMFVIGNRPAAAQSALAELKMADGSAAGTATFTQTPHGVLIMLKAQKLPPGDHAMHIHAVGQCEPPFTSAGGHFNPGQKKHGMMAADGAHAGDMPNLHVPASGEVQVEVLNGVVTLAKDQPNSLFDADGSALVIHASADDYKSDPAGNAGDRIACGTITK